MITGGSDHTIEENLMGFARWRTILVLSPTVGNVTVQRQRDQGQLRRHRLRQPGHRPDRHLTLTRNYIHDSVDNGSGSTEFAFFVTQTGMTGSTSIIGNTVQNVDRPVLDRRRASGARSAQHRHRQRV